MYYLQNKASGYDGNHLIFWRKGKAGYTTSLAEAHVFSKEDAFSQNRCRDTDIPWSKKYLDRNSKGGCVDAQYVRLSEALTNEEHKSLWKASPPPKPKYRCGGCGRFMSIKAFYTTNCPNCGSCNAP